MHIARLSLTQEPSPHLSLVSIHICKLNLLEILDLTVVYTSTTCWISFKVGIQAQVRRYLDESVLRYDLFVLQLWHLATLCFCGLSEDHNLYCISHFSDSQSSNCFLQDFCVRLRLFHANGCDNLHTITNKLAHALRLRCRTEVLLPVEIFFALTRRRSHHSNCHVRHDCPPGIIPPSLEEGFEHNRSRPNFSQVQPVICWHLLVFFFSWFEVYSRNSS